LFELGVEKFRNRKERERKVNQTQTRPNPRKPGGPVGPFPFFPRPSPARLRTGPRFGPARSGPSRFPATHAKPSTLSRSPANPASTRSLSHRCPGPTCRHCLLHFPSSPRPNCSAHWTTAARLPPRCAVARPASQAYRPASPERPPLPEVSPTELGDHAEPLLDPLSPHGTNPGRVSCQPSVHGAHAQEPGAPFNWHCSRAPDLPSSRSRHLCTAPPRSHSSAAQSTVRRRSHAAPPHPSPGQTRRSPASAPASFPRPAPATPAREAFGFCAERRRR
jgi:hypothetical protein